MQDHCFANNHIRYALSKYQLFLFMFFSYLITNHFTVANNQYFFIAIVFVSYSIILEYLLGKLFTHEKKKNIIWGICYCPPMFLTILIFILNNY